MQTSKRVLLNFIFAFSIIGTVILLIDNILNTVAIFVNLSWLQGDANVAFIFGWIALGYFILTIISSYCWIKNIGNGFWVWKLPTLLFLPFSIPFLIITYCEKNKNNQVNVVEK